MHFRDRVASKYWYDTIQNTRYGCLEGYRSGKTLVFRGVLTGVEDCLNMDIYRPDTQQTGRIRWISRSSLMQQTSSLSA